MSIRIAAFASGGGTNVQALLDHFRPEAVGGAVARVALVVSDREDAYALERARRVGVETHVVPVTGRDEETVASETLAVLDAAAIDIVALAGYVRLVPQAVVRRYAGRMLNVHPALLPAFGGKGMYGVRIHRAVLARGCTVSGVTVHFVDEEYDEGPILCQWPVPVRDGDSPESLAARVLTVEHRLYPAAVEWLARRLLEERGGQSGRIVPQAAMAAEPWSFGFAAEEVPAWEDIRRALGLPDSGRRP
ncbi:MAG TPA: phosphoribosylglycinamide formyltransferase [Longimicrobiales bacterium]|nr:phosphoribosylglycinamide formyltransferase [Longimicrobiales bacterium]